MKAKYQPKNFKKSITVKVFAIPLIVVVTILYVSIAYLLIDINKSNADLFNLMKRSGEYQLDATNMQASNSVLSETSSTYVRMPLNSDNSPNVGPLMAYVAELNSDWRAPKVAARFHTYDVSYEVLSNIEKAKELSEKIKDTQIHAIALISSVYSLPPIPELQIFTNATLTDTELAMSNDDRIAYARTLITESSYAQNRYHIQDSITKCNETLRQEFAKATSNTEHHVNIMRNILIMEMSSVIVILCAGFTVFYLWIVKPLRAYSKDITSNKKIDSTTRITEMNQLANSFNNLWDYRNKLEVILRTEAENDALTGLPNRYCMEHDLLKSINTDSSFAVVMFDINFLKRTNDSKGHLAGDTLIRTAAACIRECFGLDSLNNCYRIGGDEYISLMVGCSEEDIKRRIDKFKLALIREDISVSVGYSYASKAESNIFKTLMEEADKKMYEQKKHIHEIDD